MLFTNVPNDFHFFHSYLARMLLADQPHSCYVRMSLTEGCDMATPGQFVEVMAEALGVPEATVVVHDRNLVVAGLRSKGGRGRSAAQVTERDAANLLTAILASAQVRDSVDSVKRYSKTKPHRHTSSADGYKKSGIKELAELPTGHSFIDALEALIAAAASGTLAEAIHADAQGLRVSAPALIEVAALTPGTIGDIRIAGLGDRLSVNVRYAQPTPWDASSKPTQRDVAVWEAKMRKQHPRTDLEQYRRISARTIYKLGEALARKNGGKDG
jgi:hypothetical protein